MGARREAPAAFVAEMRSRFPDFQDVRFNDLVNRWEFIFTSAAGRPVSQFLVWSRNPMTGEVIAPDPVSGLCPFRELDEAAQRYVIESCTTTYIGNRVDGARDWTQKVVRHLRDERDRRTDGARKRAEDYAYLIQQMDIRRPGWRKDHQPSGRRQHFDRQARPSGGVKDTIRSGGPDQRGIVTVSTLRTRKSV